MPLFACSVWESALKGGAQGSGGRAGLHCKRTHGSGCAIIAPAKRRAAEHIDRKQTHTAPGVSHKGPDTISRPRQSKYTGERSHGTGRAAQEAAAKPAQRENGHSHGTGRILHLAAQKPCRRAKKLRMCAQRRAVQLPRPRPQFSTVTHTEPGVPEQKPAALHPAACIPPPTV